MERLPSTPTLHRSPHGAHRGQAACLQGPLAPTRTLQVLAQATQRRLALTHTPGARLRPAAHLQLGLQAHTHTAQAQHLTARTRHLLGSPTLPEAGVILLAAQAPPLLPITRRLQATRTTLAAGAVLPAAHQARRVMLTILEAGVSLKALSRLEATATHTVLTQQAATASRRVPSLPVTLGMATAHGPPPSLALLATAPRRTMLLVQHQQ